MGSTFSKKKITLCTKCNKLHKKYSNGYSMIYCPICNICVQKTDELNLSYSLPSKIYKHCKVCNKHHNTFFSYINGKFESYLSYCKICKECLSNNHIHCDKCKIISNIKIHCNICQICHTIKKDTFYCEECKSCVEENFKHLLNHKK